MNIIGGIAKGHKIYSSDNIRPTRGMVREALFSIIDISGKTFLDLFSGSGAVGIEALSRGASSAVFVERSRKCVSFIERNLEKTGFEGRVINRSVGSALKFLDEKFDCIFMDPPYRSGLIEKTLQNLDDNLKDESVVVVESPSDFSYEINGFRMVKEKNYGDSALRFFKK